MPHDTEAGRYPLAGPADTPRTGRGARPPRPAAPPQPPPPAGAPLHAGGHRTPPRPAHDPSPGPAFAARWDGEPYGADPGPPTWKLRPIRDEEPRRGRPAGRTLAAAVCLVLGVGLLGGSAAGAWLTGDDDRPGAAAGDFDEARALWHSVPVDDLFPRTLDGDGAGPGGADRAWTRIAVAPDGDCRQAFDPLLAKALSPVGCSRLLRATYADETSTSVTTVGMMFARADEIHMRGLSRRFATENLAQRTDLMPRPYAARGTLAADFGDAQRASWTIRVLTDAPVVVYAVTGFADGRVVSDPQAAADAVQKGETTATAQAGLGNDAQGIADRVERRLRAHVEGAGGANGDGSGGRGSAGRNDHGTDGTDGADGADGAAHPAARTVPGPVPFPGAASPPGTGTGTGTGGGEGARHDGSPAAAPAPAPAPEGSAA